MPGCLLLALPSSVRPGQLEILDRPGSLHLRIKGFQSSHLFFECCDPIVESDRLAHRSRSLFAIHPIQLLQVLIDALFDEFIRSFIFALVKLRSRCVDCFETWLPFNRNDGLREQSEPPT